MTLTLLDIHCLARMWCPKPARWEKLLRDPDYWGAAHELAHALLSTPEERTRPDYGLCPAGHCACPWARCHVVELAAIAISGQLVQAAGRPELEIAEIDITPNLSIMDTSSNRRRARMLLAGELWPPPTTRDSLARLCERRLGAASSAVAQHDPIVRGFT